MSRILLVRHGRSEANDAGLWQGHGDSPLSDTGRDQAKALGQRLGDVRPSLVIASDLARARSTAEAVGGADEIDLGWKEMFLGAWEGQTFERVMQTHPEMLGAIRRGESIRFGDSGETLGEFEDRVNDAFDRLVERVEYGQTAIVVTHGGAIDVIVARFLGRIQGRRAYPIVTNTSLTELKREDDGAWRMARFNDAAHLAETAGFLGGAPEQGYAVVGLVRHGVTAANRERRIQGQSCWGLNTEGFEQAQSLVSDYPKPTRLYSSPTRRAMETSAAFKMPIIEDDRLMEVGFGKWEGLTDAEVRPTELAKRIWEDGEDLPRGETGETFAQTQARMMAFLSDLVVDPTVRTVAVSHGGAIRSAIAGVVGRGFDIERDLQPLPNASVSHLALDGPDVRQEGWMIIDIGVTPGATGDKRSPAEKEKT